MREISQHSARRSVTADDHRHTAHDQRREQITEAIRMRDRNHTKIQIGVADSHGIANLITIRQQLLASKENCTRRVGCSGGKLQNGRLPIPSRRSADGPEPRYLWGGSAGNSGHYSTGTAEPERSIALWRANRFFQRENNQLSAQTSDQERRP